MYSVRLLVYKDAVDGDEEVVNEQIIYVNELEEKANKFFLDMEYSASSMRMYLEYMARVKQAWEKEQH